MEEKNLMRMFENDVENIPMLGQDEEIIVARQSQMGDEVSRNRLVESNLRFVLTVVFKYWSPGMPLMDMISEGCLGLMKAARTFDPDKGFRFVTYAGSAIGQHVIKAIQRHKRSRYDSLDELVYGDGEGTETTWKDTLVSSDTPDDKPALKMLICRLLECLSFKERTIINLRFFDGLTLDEVGVRVNLGKERVRQIETKALRKLRWAIDERTMIGHGSHADTVR